MPSNLQKPKFNDLIGEVQLNGVSYTFRPKTFELLKLLASSSGNVFSKAEILTADKKANFMVLPANPLTENYQFELPELVIQHGQIVSDQGKTQ